MQPLATASSAQPRSVSRPGIAAFAWGTLIYNVAVILWGALVRATGSGAGCGGHWPLCNGDVLPADPQTSTMIELTHRVMSGLAMAAVLGMFVWVRKATSARAPRRWAMLSLVFILTEALLGAGLVLLGYVAKDASVGRAYWLCAHLINTFALLASLAMTAWTLGAGERRDSQARASKSHLTLAIVALVTVAMAGVITALGDTLFPADSLARGIAEDFSPDAPFLVKLRVIHPALALLTSFLLVTLAWPEYKTRRTPQRRLLASWLLSLTGAAVLAGALTLAWRAPVPMQIVHLLVADSLWITLVLFSGEAFSQGPGRTL